MKSASVTGDEILVQQSARRDMVMEAGSVSETIEVSAAISAASPEPAVGGHMQLGLRYTF